MTDGVDATQVEGLVAPGFEEVHAEFERNFPFALSVAQSAGDPDDPVTIGAMVGPEAFTEVKYLMHAKQMQALDLVPQIAGDLGL